MSYFYKTKIGQTEQKELPEIKSSREIEATKELARELRRATNEKKRDDFVQRIRKGLRDAAPSPLTIEFNDQLIHKGDEEGHGLHKGHRLTFRVLLKNTTSKSVSGVQLQIMTISDSNGKHPTHLKGKITLPYTLPFSESGELSRSLGPGQSALVDVFSYKKAYLSNDINFGGKNGVGVYGGNYFIELQASCLDGNPLEKKFNVGLTDIGSSFSEPYMHLYETKNLRGEGQVLIVAHQDSRSDPR